MSLLNGTRLTWLGHATALLELTNGTRILIDPFLEHNPKYPKNFPMPKIDYVLLTHGHSDHMADAAPIAKKDGATVVAMVELAGYLTGKGVEKTVGINLGGTYKLPGASVTMVEAKHSSSVEESGQIVYLGDAAGLVITVDDGPVIYHAGDTTVFRDMELIEDLYKPEIALLCIGGHYTMGPREAALAVKFLKPKLVVPIHWGTFPPLVGRPEELAAIVGEKLVAHIEPGQSLEA